VFSQVDDGGGFPAMFVHHETDSAHPSNLTKRARKYIRNLRTIIMR
jgi:hypothetical protein